MLLGLAGSWPSGEGTAEPGDSFFTTTTEEGANTLILKWRGNYQEEKSTTKASGGAACNSENLQLTSMCSETPDVRNWRIRNPNNESFTVSWKVYGTEHVGTIEVPEGDVYFTTPAVQGNNTVKIFWQDRLGNNKSTTKASMNRLCKVEKLKLTSVCSDDAQVRRWRIRNPNGFEVSVNWQLYGAGVSGSLQAPAGDSFFTTPANSGVNTVKIFWKDEEGNIKQKTKASSNKLCSTVYYFPGENKYGSLAYEDLWPNRGDYDFNDVVVDFNIMAVYKGQFIDHLKLSFKLKTNGTIYKNGFGIHMPVPAESIENVSGTVRSSNTIQDMGNGVEGGHNADGTSTIVIFDDASALVVPFTHPASPYEINVMIDFKEEVGFDLVEDFVGGLNPFIFVNNRGKEVHLANMLPTSLADESLLGTRADVTQLPNTSYVTSNGLPWAIYTPVSFSYPKEEVEITKAYPAFQTWAESGGTSNVSWYLSPLTSEIED
ncbi:LruC domain-containing protein [Porifericola rhodea]|uniref:LruC domain-containing protein n=1 Tax=Porifericola rhodea TaxID=930972 RepID=UPI0026656FC3|nr:LruC domain-containing protein [Porifericola rhodea]WKN31882.1 LruC domain-containing protein [Porifericola rhodea]